MTGVSRYDIYFAPSSYVCLLYTSVAYAMKLAPETGKDKIIVITISGRGDKACAQIARYRGVDI